MILLRRVLVFAAVLLLCSGCFVVQVERPVGGEEPRFMRQHFFLFGRVGEYEIDLTQECPQGIASFGDRFTVGDVVIGVLTAGIYTPRTVVLRCARAGGGS